MAAGCPFRWTTTTALVRGVIRCSNSTGSAHRLTGSTSANTGMALWCSAAVAEATKV
jgi:hypothetical protein